MARILRIAGAVAALSVLGAPARGERAGVRRHTAAGAAASRAEASIPLGGRRGLSALLGAAGVLFAAGQEAAAEQETSAEGVAAEANVLQSRFETFDQNKDGKVDKEEHLEYARKFLVKEQMDEKRMKEVLQFYEELFDAANVDGDDSLSEKELAFADFLLHVARRVEVEGEDEGEKKEGEGEAKATRRFDFGFDHAKANLDHHDLDDDGVITKEEYFEGMRKFASEWGWEASFEDADVQDWMNKVWDLVDVDESGTLSVPEVLYLQIIVERAAHSGQFDGMVLASLMFEVLDDDNDGKISEDEISQKLAAVEELARLMEDAAEHGKPEGDATSEAATGDDDAEPRQKDEVDWAEMLGVEIVSRIGNLFAEADLNGDKSLDQAEAKRMANRIVGEL